MRRLEFRDHVARDVMNVDERLAQADRAARTRAREVEQVGDEAIRTFRRGANSLADRRLLGGVEVTQAEQFSGHLDGCQWVAEIMPDDAQRLFGQQYPVLRHRALVVQLADVLHDAHQLRGGPSAVAFQAAPGRDPALHAIHAAHSKDGVIPTLRCFEERGQRLCLGLPIRREHVIDELRRSHGALDPMPKQQSHLLLVVARQ